MESEKQKSAKSDKMLRSRDRALSVLAVQPNYSKAAEELGIGRDQIYNWLKDDDFRQEVDKLRTSLVDEAISSLKSSVKNAAQVLSDLLDDDNPQVRRAAANDIINHVAKFIEYKDIDKRLKELESYALKK